MENTCKKCGENLYGNKLKCPFCGHPINQSVKKDVPHKRNQYSYDKNKPQKPAVKKNNSMLEAVILLVLAYFFFPLGFIFFFAYNKQRTTVATISLILGIVGLVNYLA